MSEPVKIKPSKALREFCKTHFRYNGRKFYVEYCTSVALHDVAWGGGSRKYYKAINSDGQTLSIAGDWVNPFSKNCVEGRTVAITPTMALLSHTYFCGHDMGITVYLAPPNQLPETSTLLKQLTAPEKS